MILVAGGTGRLGSLVANHLSERGLEVRVLSRGLKPDPGTLRDDIEVVQGDVRAPASLTAAMDGVDVVVAAVQGFLGPDGVTPETVDRLGNINLVTAAEAVGADIVIMSVIGAAPDSPMELFRMKYDAEQRLRSSTSKWTVVRADAYSETWVAILEETAGRSGRPLVFGRGDNPISWVSVHDVAALVERAVTNPSLRGRTLEICGPEPMTLTELAAKVMSQRGVAGKPPSRWTSCPPATAAQRVRSSRTCPARRCPQSSSHTRSTTGARSPYDLNTSRTTGITSLGRIPGSRCLRSSPNRAS